MTERVSPASITFHIGYARGDFWIDGIRLYETQPPSPQTYYVAPDGVDSNPGTRAQPWKTIGHAAETLAAGDTVVVMGGVYRVSDALTFGPAGLSSERMTTYRSEDGARAIFSGMDDRPPGVWMHDSSVPPLTPFLETSQDTIELKSVVGRNPPAETLRLRNRGIGMLNWHATVGVPWVELGVVHGTIDVADQTTLSVVFATQAMPQGRYTTDVRLTYDDKTVIIPVQLNVLSESTTKEGLLRHWTLDEGQGQITHDRIGGLDVFINGAQWASGVSGTALRFDGVDDYIQIPMPVQDFSQFTVALWFKTAVPGRGLYTGESFSDNTMWQRYMSAMADGGEISLATVDGRLRGEFNLVQGGDARALYSEAAVADDQWHLSAMTISAKEQIALFLDGCQVDRRAISEDAGLINASIGQHEIGCTVWWNATKYYSGAIDDIRLYRRALSPAEIEAVCSGDSQ